MVALIEALPMDTHRYASLPRYPGAYRDLAVVLDRDVTAASVQRHHREAPAGGPGHPLRSSTRARACLTASGPWPTACCSSTAERTLSGDEVDRAQADILAGLERELGSATAGVAGHHSCGACPALDAGAGIQVGWGWTPVCTGVAMEAQPLPDAN